MFYWIIVILTTLLFIVSVLPFFPLRQGFFRIWDFPRIQIFVATILLLASTLVFFQQQYLLWITLGLQAGTIILQLSYILRFTVIWPVRSVTFAGNPREVPIIKLMIANVKMGNREFDHCRKLVMEKDPDIAIFMETDDKWVSELQEAAKSYSHRIECPRDNAYGLMIVSKFEFQEYEIKYLTKDEIPSFDTTVVLPSGIKFRLFVVHPEPPVPTGKTLGRDAEISVVGKLVRDESKPVIVTGDLNDVAWSETTRRFLRIARLLDPREGRGFFSTFDARYFFLRWPLDHIFHSPHFQVITIKRMQHIKSDHFPMYYELALIDQKQEERKINNASQEDINKAERLIEEEKKRDDSANGTDWEEK